jgi:hypothetical protein
MKEWCVWYYNCGLRKWRYWFEEENEFDIVVLESKKEINLFIFIDPIFIIFKQTYNVIFYN